MGYATRQRDVVLSVLRQAKRPLTPQEIHEQARQESERLGLATVYRALKAFMAEGVVAQVEIPGTSPCYELTERGHHHHFICETCRQVFDLQGCLKNINTLAPEDFHVERHDIILYGVCAACAEAPGYADESSFD